MILTKYRIEELKRLINNAVGSVYKHDMELLIKSGMERSAAFRFGVYFDRLKIRTRWLSSLHIDMEYNKHGEDPKRIPSRRTAKQGVQPDFILHLRGCDNWNILVIEFKHWSTCDGGEADMQKLRDFTSQEGKYKYGLSVFIKFGKERPECEYFLDYEPKD
jgi:hypothetical protein